jgi:3-hydroxyisobutyrate dehydrogenase-like beta-hydroxyacid dehydrogenase
MITTTSTRLAVLGLGNMGTPIARRLLERGHQVAVWNRTSARAAALQGAGATVQASAAAAVAEANVVISMLADDAAVAAVAADHAAALQPGSLVLEMSTVHPQTVAQLRHALPDGVDLVDAPVLGSVDAARRGELGILVGGTPDAVDRATPLLQELGRPVRTGPLGSAAAAKVALMSALIPAVLSIGEAVAVGRGLGLDETLLRELFTSTPLGPIAARAFAEQANYPARLAAKDLTLAQTVVAAPLITASRAVLAAAGSPELDLGAVARTTQLPLRAG